MEFNKSNNITDRHPLKKELDFLIEKRDQINRLDFANYDMSPFGKGMLDLRELVSEVLKCTDNLNIRIHDMLPKIGHQVQFSLFSEVLMPGPDGKFRLKYSFDFEKFDEFLSSYPISSYDSALNNVIAQSKDILSMKIPSEGKIQESLEKEYKELDISDKYRKFLELAGIDINNLLEYVNEPLFPKKAEDIKLKARLIESMEESIKFSQFIDSIKKIRKEEEQLEKEKESIEKDKESIKFSMAISEYIRRKLKHHFLFGHFDKNYEDQIFSNFNEINKEKFNFVDSLIEESISIEDCQGLIKVSSLKKDFLFKMNYFLKFLEVNKEPFNMILNTWPLENRSSY
tara:strand:- start:559 stop:1587 length:1029 start_codon:yes stop_codon:yes gene_type:complete